MSRLRWPDSTNSVSEKPGTIQSARAVAGERHNSKGNKSGLSYGRWTVLARFSVTAFRPRTDRVFSRPA